MSSFDSQFQHMLGFVIFDQDADDFHKRCFQPRRGDMIIAQGVSPVLRRKNNVKAPAAAAYYVAAAGAKIYLGMLFPRLTPWAINISPLRG
jgi:hypothetical protein